ncbi:MAG: hypothetical protein H0X15_11885 [Acidobacteria bacterium]|nr:hypothetical protein [Acidobacteriota bacterium]
MQVNRSAYYVYARGETHRESPSRINCVARIKECFYIHHRRRYGRRRIAVELKIGRHRVRKVLQRENLRAIAPKKFKPQMTDSKHGQPVSPNLLQHGANTPESLGEVLVGDISYLP